MIIIVEAERELKTMKNEKKYQVVKNNFFDIYDDKVIENAKRQENIKILTEILNITKESSSLEDFIRKIESMIEADKEFIKSLSK